MFQIDRKIDCNSFRDSDLKDWLNEQFNAPLVEKDLDENDKLLRESDRRKWGEGFIRNAPRSLSDSLFYIRKSTDGYGYSNYTGHISTDYIRPLFFKRFPLGQIWVVKISDHWWEKVWSGERILAKNVSLNYPTIPQGASGYHKRLESINAELADVNHRLERLYDALETSKLELSDLTPRIQVLRHRQDQLQSAKEELGDKFADRKAELADLKLVENYANDLRNLLSQSSLAEQKVFIRSFVKEIRVTDREVDLFYTIPLPHDETVHEKAEVPSIVQLGSGGRIRTKTKYWTTSFIGYPVQL